MVVFGISAPEGPKGPPSRESKTKILIMKAWRERWTDIQWGIHARTLIENEGDASFIADCLLQQALNGPGPNALVVSYLLHSFYSQLIPAAAVLRSISQYEAYHKPHCTCSLLDVLDNIKDRLIVSDRTDPEDCLQLALSVESVVHWLLSCMYSSLEKLSDLAGPEGPPQDSENAKIVQKSRKLVEHIFGDTYLSALLYVAIAEDPGTYEKIKRMCADMEIFSRGHNAEDIATVLLLIDRLKSYRMDRLDPRNTIMPPSVDGLQDIPANGSIQAVIMTAALLRSPKDIHSIVSDIMILKQLQGIQNVDLYCEVIHSSMIGLVDAVGKDEELKFIGFTFLQLPAVLRVLRDRIGDFSDDFFRGLEAFITNESILEIADSLLHCSTLDLLTSSLSKNGLITESHKSDLMSRKKSSQKSANGPKSNSSNAVLILKAETTLGHILKTLDGDYQKNQDAILGVLCDMLGKSFELILVAASTTGTLQQVTSRLIKLNQLSRQVSGEGTKASTTRALIFDISFLMLCHTVQTYGPQSLDSDESDCFFEEWYHSCMVEGTTAKNPEGIVARCDQNKVDMLLNQYLQGDTELKTSLVFWHEVCTNAVGVIQNLLLAWENGAVSFTDVKKVLDVFKSRICTLPVCISAWLCAYIQVMPEELCGKARYILDYFLNPNVGDESGDYFKERCAMMSSVISKMMSCIQPATESTAQKWCVKESKPASELIEECWKFMADRGQINVRTTQNLKNLMEMSGHAQFIQFIIHEMFQLQYSSQLKQWADLSYGVMQMDVKNSVEALVAHVLPAVIRFSVGSQYFVEPQLVALVTLTVDAIVSYYLHNKFQIKAEPTAGSDDGEPGAKRRKVHPTSQQFKGDSAGTAALEILLTDLYEEFEQTICRKYEKNPQGVFILRFLEQLAFKAPDLTLLHSASNKLICQLMNLLHDEINSKFLLCVYNLTERPGRRNCAEAICHLKELQHGDE